MTTWRGSMSGIFDCAKDPQSTNTTGSRRALTDAMIASVNVSQPLHACEQHALLRPLLERAVTDRRDRWHVGLELLEDVAE